MLPVLARLVLSYEPPGVGVGGRAGAAAGRKGGGGGGETWALHWAAGESGGKPYWACMSLWPEEVGPTLRACGAEAEGKEELAHRARPSVVAGRARRCGACAPSRRATALQSLRQLRGSGRRRRPPCVYETSPGAQCAEWGGSRHAWSRRASWCSHSRVGTSPGL